MSSNNSSKHVQSSKALVSARVLTLAVSLVHASGVARSAPQADPAQPSFQQGHADRLKWESWFNAQTGDAKDGALFWAGQRNLPHPQSCFSPANANAIWRVACAQAQQLLASSDVRRKTEPQYWFGWNAPTNQEPARALAAHSATNALAQQEPPAVRPSEVQARSTMSIKVIGGIWTHSTVADCANTGVVIEVGVSGVETELHTYRQDNVAIIEKLFSEDGDVFHVVSEDLNHPQGTSFKTIPAGREEIYSLVDRNNIDVNSVSEANGRYHLTRCPDLAFGELNQLKKIAMGVGRSSTTTTNSPFPPGFPELVGPSLADMKELHTPEAIACFVFLQTHHLGKTNSSDNQAGIVVDNVDGPKRFQSVFGGNTYVDVVYRIKINKYGNLRYSDEHIDHCVLDNDRNVLEISSSIK